MRGRGETYWRDEGLKVLGSWVGEEMLGFGVEGFLELWFERCGKGAVAVVMVEYERCRGDKALREKGKRF